jgi:hypothetical protein
MQFNCCSNKNKAIGSERDGKVGVDRSFDLIPLKTDGGGEDDLRLLFNSVKNMCVYSTYFIEFKIRKIFLVSYPYI